MSQALHRRLVHSLLEFASELRTQRTHPINSMTKVFVYGTLKWGGRNHRYLAGQQFLGEAHTPPGYTVYSLGDYPGMVRAPHNQEGVSGEVWSVDAVCLAGLDQLEGVAEGLYERVPLKLAPPFADDRVETYLYLRNLEGRPALGSVWREQ